MIMKAIQSVLFNEKNIDRRTYFWNTAVFISYSLQSVLMLLIVTRFGDEEIAGIFSIIYATTQMLSSIGSYNMRNFQVSDTKGEYQFGDYWTSRVISTLLMCLLGAIYAFIRFDDAVSRLVVVCFTGYRAFETIEDVIHGYVQKEGRLDAASLAKFVRIIASTLGFILVYIVFRDLLLASSVMFILSALLFAVCTYAINAEYKQIGYGFGGKKVINLLWSCLPLCIGMFLQNYIINSPKYAIDSVMTSDYQTIFSILFLPLFVVNLISQIIFNPLIVKMSKMWNDYEIDRLIKYILFQLLLIIGLTLGIAGFCYLFGCEILGLVYGVELTEYKTVLSLLIIFGGISSTVTFFFAIVTIIRKQIYVIASYSVASILSLVVSKSMVTKYGMMGACLLFGLLMSVVMVILIIVIGIELLKRRKSINCR